MGRREDHSSLDPKKWHGRRETAVGPAILGAILLAVSLLGPITSTGTAEHIGWGSPTIIGMTDLDASSTDTEIEGQPVASRVTVNVTRGHDSAKKAAANGPFIQPAAASHEPTDGICNAKGLCWKGCRRTYA